MHGSIRVCVSVVFSFFCECLFINVCYIFVCIHVCVCVWPELYMQ